PSSAAGPEFMRCEIPLAAWRSRWWPETRFRFGTPVSAHISKDLGGIREQITEEHRGTVETVVFRRNDVRRTGSVPVDGGVENRFEKITVQLVIRPLALTLEAQGDGVVAVSLLAKAHFRELGVADQEVARHKRHLHRLLPFTVK